MIFSNQNISARQMQTAILLIMFSSSLIGLPSTAVYNIYSVIMGALITVAECLIICAASKRLYFSKRINGIIKTASAISLVVYAGINIKLVCSATAMYLLPKTPFWITAAVFALGALYMAVLGIQSAGRTGEIIFIIVAVNAVLAAFICLYDTKGGLLTAAFEQAGEDVILNGLKCSFMFGGTQALFILLPNTDGENKEKKAVYAVIAALAAVVVFTYTAVSKFGLYDTAERVFPTLNIMDTVNLEAFFGDKQDVFMLRMWFFAVFAATGFEILMLGKAVKSNQFFYPRVFTGAIAAFVISFLFTDTNTAAAALYVTGGISLVLFGILAPALSIFVKKGEDRSGEEIKDTAC